MSSPHNHSYDELAALIGEPFDRADLVAWGLSEHLAGWALDNVGALGYIAATEDPVNAPVFVSRVLHGLHPDEVLVEDDVLLTDPAEVDPVASEILIRVADSLSSFEHLITDLPDHATPEARQEWLKSVLAELATYRERETAAAVARFRSSDAGASELRSTRLLELEVGGVVIDLLTLAAAPGSPGSPEEAHRAVAACEAVRRTPGTLPPAAELLVLLQEAHALRELGLSPDAERIDAAARAIWHADQLPHLGYALERADEDTTAAIDEIAEALGVADVLEEARSSVSLSDFDLEELQRPALVAGGAGRGGLPSDVELALMRAVDARRGLRGPEELAAAGSLLTWDRLDPSIRSDV